MIITKRSGHPAKYDESKITERIIKECRDEPKLDIPDVERLVEGVSSSIKQGMHTHELDLMVARRAQDMCVENHKYSRLAARIYASNCQKTLFYNLCSNFGISMEEARSRHLYYVMRALYENCDEQCEQYPLVDESVYKFVIANEAELTAAIDLARDNLIDYPGLCDLNEKYLMKAMIKTPLAAERTVVELPQHMFMRVALGIWTYVPRSRQFAEEDIAKFSGIVAPHTYAAWQAANRAGRLDKRDIIEMLQSKIPVMARKSHPAYRAYKFAKSLAPANADITISQSLADVLDCYNVFSHKLMTQATPTLFNAGTPRPQFSSCYLMMNSDALSGIFDFIGRCAQISKYAGGLGSAHHNVRGTDAYIRGTNGRSNGLIPMMKVIEAVSVYVDQGGGKRPGSHSPYIELWHSDILDMIASKNPMTTNVKRVDKLSPAMWVCDEFMRALAREIEDSKVGINEPRWYLFSRDVGNFTNLYDDLYVDTWMEMDTIRQNKEKLAFTYSYRKAVDRGLYSSRVSAITIWNAITETIAATGMPYMVSKDAGNRMSNQKHYGVIHSSNLCTEIMEVTSLEESAVCNLASICLPEYVRDYDPARVGVVSVVSVANDARDAIVSSVGTAWFDFDTMSGIVRRAVRNLNRILDINYYPTDDTKWSNLRHRPLGIGVQGLADVFTRLGYAFDSEAAIRLDQEIHEEIYYSALDESANMAKENGAYETFPGSPSSEGLLKLHLMSKYYKPPQYALRRDWSKLVEKVKSVGLRNSLLIALMPTKSTSVIMGNSSAFEPHNGIVFKQKIKSGEFIQINRDLVEMLNARGLWNIELADKVLKSNSIQAIEEIPADIRALFKTAFDMPISVIMKHAVARSYFVDQSISMNLFQKEFKSDNFTKAMFYGWRNGLTTWSYYNHTLAATDAQKVATLSKSKSGENGNSADSVTIQLTESTDGDFGTPLICRRESGCTICES